MEAIKSKGISRYPYLIIVLASLLICLTLFYIDEGRYSLDGIFDQQNIPAMVIYFCGFALMAFIIYRLLLLRFQPVGSLIAALILTLPAGFLFALFVFYLTSLFL